MRPLRRIPLASGRSWRRRASRISPLLAYVEGGWGGEAGVLAKLFSILPTRAGFAVEFGQRAIGSGTVAELIAERGWGALYMDRETAAPLERRPAARGGAITLARETIAPSNINELFAKHRVPEELDCLVIDIDGLDYWVWDRLDDRYTPSLVVVEFNPHVGAGVAATIHPDESWTYRRTRDYGASFGAMQELGARKGYRLVHVHGCWNLYFVRDGLEFPDELAVRAPLRDSDLATLTDTEGFYDSLCDGGRPSWIDAPPPDVSHSPWLVLAPDPGSATVDLDGISLDVVGDEHEAARWARRKRAEERASALYRLIRDAGFANFVDIGAGVGLSSILARRSSPRIRTVAVEADPRRARLLRRNFARHGLADADVVTALAGAEEAPSRGLGVDSSSAVDGTGVESASGVQVPMVRIDRVLDTLQVRGPTFFKVDAQGFEQGVLTGLEACLDASSAWRLKLAFAPYRLESRGTDPLTLLRYLTKRYEVTEFPARIRFGTPSLDSLFSAAVPRERADELLAHVTALDMDGRGSIDLLVRPLDGASGC